MVTLVWLFVIVFVILPTIFGVVMMAIYGLGCLLSSEVPKDRPTVPRR